MEKTCMHCGVIFESKRDTGKYCSGNCKQMAYFKRTVSSETDIKINKTDSMSIINLGVDNRKLIEDILNEVAIRVIKLIELRKMDSAISCNMEPFNVKSFIKSSKLV